MTDWSDPLVIATIGLVVVTAGLLIATIIYAFYSKKLSEHTADQVKLLANQEKLQKLQNRVLKATIEVTKLTAELGWTDKNYYSQKTSKILEELKEVDVT